MTAEAMLKKLRRANRGRSFELADSGNAIGVWCDKTEKFVTCAVLTIVDEKWLGHVGPEIRVNGKRVYTYRKALKK